MPILNEVLQTLVYPSLIAIAGTLVKFYLQWSLGKGREALVAATERAAGAIFVNVQNAPGGEMEALAKDLAKEAEKIIETNFAATLNKLGQPVQGTIAGMVLGEFGKLIAKQN